MHLSDTALWILNRHISDRRTLFALVGPPGAGKSTISESLVTELNEYSGRHLAAVVHMDGFHLSNEVLIDRNRLNRKGSPDTFDVDGLARLIQQIEANNADISYPTFDRELDTSIADNGFLPLDTEIVLIEGNYLLLNEEPWCQLSGLFDFSIYISPGIDELERRLIQRWLDHGFSEEEAKAKAFNNDMLNVKTVEMYSAPADYYIKNV